MEDLDIITFSKPTETGEYNENLLELESKLEDYFKTVDGDFESLLIFNKILNHPIPVKKENYVSKDYTKYGYYSFKTESGNWSDFYESFTHDISYCSVILINIDSNDFHIKAITLTIEEKNPKKVIIKHKKHSYTKSIKKVDEICNIIHRLILECI